MDYIAPKRISLSCEGAVILVPRLVRLWRGSAWGRTVFEAPTRFYSLKVKCAYPKHLGL